MKKDFTYIDLFSGIGGFRLALDSLNGKCLGFSEINKDAIEVYCKNFNEPSDSNFGDITKIKKLPKSNLLTAGVPCQSWSIAGRNLGFDDDRGQLWNDTIYLLNQSKPDSFIFENVKGLVDPRNSEALEYILKRIKEAGYKYKVLVLNSFDFGVPQNRVRIYIVGFKNEKYLNRFIISNDHIKKVWLKDILSDYNPQIRNLGENTTNSQTDLFGNKIKEKRNFSLSTSNGMNDYFLFNDIRNGHTTIHSWEINDTTVRQKEICELLLKNRRKKTYGLLDGNPLSLSHFKQLDETITKEELEELVNLGILKPENYKFELNEGLNVELDSTEQVLLENVDKYQFSVDELKINREIKKKRISITKTISTLIEKGLIKCIEVRYDFKNTKISSGLNGINRIFLPKSSIFPTLVASDTNDYVSTIDFEESDKKKLKDSFLNQVYKQGHYRKITKEEACLIQGFPQNFNLPNTRARWMKLIGNSVSVPVIKALVDSIIKTGVFDD